MGPEREGLGRIVWASSLRARAGMGMAMPPNSYLTGVRRGRGIAIFTSSPATITPCHRPVRRFGT